MVWLEIGLLALAYLAALLLSSVLKSIPVKELHRRGRSDLPGHRAAKQISRLQGYGMVGKAFIWIVAIASVATLLIWAIRTSLWLGVVVVIFENLATMAINKIIAPDKRLFSVVGYLAVPVVWLLHWLDPLWVKMPQPQTKPKHTQSYEVEDLVELLKRQSQQTDNRISVENLKTAQSALTFDDKKASDMSVRLSEVRLVLPDESVGPHLMDELYASGHSAFPVGKKVGKKLPPELKGLVYMDDLVANPLRGSVAQLMSSNLNYISSDVSLSQAMEIFLKHHTSLLVVNDEHDEPTAVLWLEDVLSQLLGRKLTVQADNPADADAREKMVE